MCGLAQVVAHHREANFFNSHIFAQPPRAPDSAQAQ
jgi:hypothetical protein